MADTSVLGKFLWHELLTTHPKAAAAFYPKVTGWKTQAWEQNADYTMWVAKSGPVGGFMPLQDSALSAGAKPHWLPYIGAPDIESSVEKAAELGAVIVTPVTDIPNAGRYAVLADPQGALFGVYASPNATAPGAPTLGDFSWHELAATDYRAAFDFYEALFGWEKTGEHDMGPMGIYFMFGLDGVPFGGMFNKHADTPAHWLNYALVSDANKAAKAAAKAGGRVINGPMEVPGGDWITQILDPQGAAFAVHAKAAAGAASPEAAEPPPASKTTEAPARPAKKSATARASQKAKPAAKKAAAKPKPKSAAKTKTAKVKKTAKKASTATKKASKKAAKKVSRKASKKNARKPAVRKSAVKKKAGAKRKTAAKKKAARKK